MHARIDAIYRLSFAIVGDEADARDVTQETFIAAWRRFRELRDPDRFDAWLQRIAVNAARMTLRARGRRRVREIPSGDVAALATASDRRRRPAPIGRPRCGSRPHHDRPADDPGAPPPRGARRGRAGGDPRDPRRDREVATPHGSPSAPGRPRLPRSKRDDAARLGRRPARRGVPGAVRRVGAGRPREECPRADRRNLPRAVRRYACRSCLAARRRGGRGHPRRRHRDDRPGRWRPDRYVVYPAERGGVRILGSAGDPDRAGRSLRSSSTSRSSTSARRSRFGMPVSTSVRSRSWAGSRTAGRSLARRQTFSRSTRWSSSVRTSSCG